MKRSFIQRSYKYNTSAAALSRTTAFSLQQPFAIGCPYFLMTGIIALLRIPSTIMANSITPIRFAIASCRTIFISCCFSMMCHAARTTCATKLLKKYTCRHPAEDAARRQGRSTGEVAIRERRAEI